MSKKMSVDDIIWGVRPETAPETPAEHFKNMHATMCDCAYCQYWSLRCTICGHVIMWGRPTRPGVTCSDPACQEAARQARDGLRKTLEAMLQ